MRIVGGTLSGRRFGSTPSASTRPTSERAREAIASAIDARGGFVGAVVLDLFAGTGAFAFEALSRGASLAVLVDRDAKARRAITASAMELGLADRTQVLAIDLASRSAASALSAQAEGPFDRVFCDPPYADAVELVPELLAALGQARLIQTDALIVIEHDRKSDLVLPVAFELVSHYRYGDTAIELARYRIEGVP